MWRSRERESERGRKSEGQRRESFISFDEANRLNSFLIHGGWRGNVLEQVMGSIRVGQLELAETVEIPSGVGEESFQLSAFFTNSSIVGEVFQ